jgi:hypothetical protein
MKWEKNDEEFTRYGFKALRIGVYVRKYSAGFKLEVAAPGVCLESYSLKSKTFEEAKNEAEILTKQIILNLLSEVEE